MSFFNSTDFSIIYASTPDGLIGNNNGLPWQHISEDMKWFRSKTENHIVIMGHNTFEAIGRVPFKNRLNIVITRDSIQYIENSLYGVSTVEEAISFACAKSYELSKPEVFIVGGAKTYTEFMQRGLVSKVYHTLIDVDGLTGDTYYTPDFDQLLLLEYYSKNDTSHPLNYSFRVYTKTLQSSIIDLIDIRNNMNIKPGPFGMFELLDVYYANLFEIDLDEYCERCNLIPDSANRRLELILAHALANTFEAGETGDFRSKTDRAKRLFFNLTDKYLRPKK